MRFSKVLPWLLGTVLAAGIVASQGVTLAVPEQTSIVPTPPQPSEGRSIAPSDGYALTPEMAGAFAELVPGHRVSSTRLPHDMTPLTPEMSAGTEGQMLNRRPGGMYAGFEDAAVTPELRAGFSSLMSGRQ